MQRRQEEERKERTKKLAEETLSKTKVSSTLYDPEKIKKRPQSAGMTRSQSGGGEESSVNGLNKTAGRPQTGLGPEEVLAKLAREQQAWDEKMKVRGGNYDVYLRTFQHPFI